jgi:hemerythrin-like domain-containing protein
MIVAGAEELSQWIERFLKERETLPPVDLLKGEHHVIQAVLDAMETICAGPAGSRWVGGDFWHQAVDFIESFVDRCHHQKEEEVLFPLLLGRTRSERVGPIVAMKHEHVEGRVLKEALRHAADGSDAERLCAAAAGYIRLLREHMASEEQGAFEMDRRITARRAQRMRDEFGRVERETLGEGGYERYLQLAQEICRQAERER